jgi:hypothetical protein
MALSNPSPYPTPEQTNTAMRVATGDIMETIARTREVLRQSAETLKRADRLLDGNTGHGSARAKP